MLNSSFYQGARVELSAKNLKVMDQMPPSAPRYEALTVSSVHAINNYSVLFYYL